MLCAQCSLIAHAKCAGNAPPTCDLRAHLLLYRELRGEGGPRERVRALSSSSGGGGAERRDVGRAVRRTADEPRRALVDAPPPPPPQGGPPRGHAGARADRVQVHGCVPPVHARASRRSRAPSRAPLRRRTQRSARRTMVRRHPAPPARRRPGVLHRRSERERPLSVTSDSTGLSSVRSAATAAESFSSRQQTGRPRAGGARGRARGVADHGGDGGDDGDDDGDEGDGGARPRGGGGAGALPVDDEGTRRQGKKHKGKSASASSCLIQ